MCVAIERKSGQFCSWAFTNWSRNNPDDLNQLTAIVTISQSARFKQDFLCISRKGTGMDKDTLAQSPNSFIEQLYINA